MRKTEALEIIEEAPKIEITLLNNLRQRGRERQEQLEREISTEGST